MRLPASVVAFLLSVASAAPLATDLPRGNAAYQSLHSSSSRSATTTLSMCFLGQRPSLLPHFSHNTATLTMKVSKGKSKHSLEKSSQLTAANHLRTSTAGRRGTKNFVDPNKLWVGNVPYDATENDLLSFFGQHLGTTHNIESVKIIRDWKTGNSKGYGFVNFLDPMSATAAMESVRGRNLNGRVLVLSQGRRKKPEGELYVKKKKTKAGDAEGMAIESGLDEAEGSREEESESDVLSLLESADDAVLFDNEDDDDDDFQFDGVFEEEYQGSSGFDPLDKESQTPMNRAQRREAESRKKRKKLPHKGFEPFEP